MAGGAAERAAIDTPRVVHNFGRQYCAIAVRIPAQIYLIPWQRHPVTTFGRVVDLMIPVQLLVAVQNEIWHASLLVNEPSGPIFVMCDD